MAIYPKINVLQYSRLLSIDYFSEVHFYVISQPYFKGCYFKFVEMQCLSSNTFRRTLRVPYLWTFCSSSPHAEHEGAQLGQTKPAPTDHCVKSRASLVPDRDPHVLRNGRL